MTPPPTTTTTFSQVKEVKEEAGIQEHIYVRQFSRTVLTDNLLPVEVDS